MEMMPFLDPFWGYECNEIMVGGQDKDGKERQKVTMNWATLLALRDTLIRWK